jgi:regulator of replication initiation timing
LSLQERRQRNKTASAKYRAKKNQQHHEMRSVIHSLTKENDVLLRQLEQVKSENRQLKYVCDKLRSKMMAEKMLKKMLQQQQTKDHATQPISNPDDPTPKMVSGERPMEPMQLDESDSDSMYNEESDETYVSSVYDSKHV